MGRRKAARADPKQVLTFVDSGSRDEFVYMRLQKYGERLIGYPRIGSSVRSGPPGALNRRRALVVFGSCAVVPPEGCSLT